MLGDKVSPTAVNSSEVSSVRRQRCYPRIGNGGPDWCSSSNPFLSVGFSIQEEAIDITQYAPQKAHYHTGVYLACLSLSVGFPILGEAMDVARSPPQEAHCHADVIYSLS